MAADPAHQPAADDQEFRRAMAFIIIGGPHDLIAQLHDKGVRDEDITPAIATCGRCAATSYVRRAEMVSDNPAGMLNL